MLFLQRILKKTAAIDHGIGTFFKIIMSKHMAVGLVIILLFVFFSKTTLFDRVLVKDAFNYVHKAMEIKESSFCSLSLFRPQAIGWPIFLSFIFYIFGTDTIFEAMFIARWVSIALVCLSIIPLYIIGQKLNERNRYYGISLLILVAYSLSPLMHFSGRNVMTEPLFCFLILWSFVFLVDKGDNLKGIVLSSLFASLSYWVRPNGIFQLAVILTTIVLLNKDNLGRAIKFIVIASFVFLFVSAPHLFLRFQQFGSPFDFGDNSKYFVDSYAQVWTSNIKAPSLIDYLRDHSWRDYYSKFIENGLFEICISMSRLLLPPLWVLLFLCGVVLAILQKRKETYSFVVLFAVSIAGLSLVYEVFGTVRHLIFFIPFMLLIATSCISRITIFNTNISNILTVLLLSYTVVTGPKIVYFKTSHIQVPEVKDQWALWAAEHLDGKIAMVEGGSVLRMSQHYTIPQMNRKPLSFGEVDENIYPIRPDVYASLADAVIDFKEQNIKYVITDLVGCKKRPYLNEISEKKWQNGFERLKYFPHGKRGANLLEVSIYKIHYDKLP